MYENIYNFSYIEPFNEYLKVNKEIEILNDKRNSLVYRLKKLEFWDYLQFLNDEIRVAEKNNDKDLLKLLKDQLYPLQKFRLGDYSPIGQSPKNVNIYVEKQMKFFEK